MVSPTGFGLGEIELVLDGAVQRDTTLSADAVDDARGDDAVPAPLPVPVTRLGDLWALGQHRLLCGDARNENSYARLLGGETVDLVFTDPPYNVPINGHVSGLSVDAQVDAAALARVLAILPR